jgi:hypothetical protein
MPSTNLPRPRAVLSKVQAIEIFQIKLAADDSMIPSPSAECVAVTFGISEKTVRDIWKGRTWARETYHLDPTRPVLEKKGFGRLQGSEDSMPRNVSWHLNAGLARRRPNSIKQAPPFLETHIKHNNPSGCVQRFHVGHVSQQQSATTYSVDYQLHEWTMGISSPSLLVDPFQSDWVMASECSNEN